MYATNKPHVCNYYFHYYHPPCLVNPLVNDNQQKKEQPYNGLYTRVLGLGNQRPKTEKERSEH